MSGVVVSIGGVLRVLVVLAAAGILVMPERHTLPRHDGGHALRGDGQRQHQNSEKAEETLMHRRPLYRQMIGARGTAQVPFGPFLSSSRNPRETYQCW